MPKNMNTLDRVIRAVFALLVAVLLLTGTLSGTWGIILGVLAAVFLLTSIVGFCPLYGLFKFSTLKK